MAKAKGSALRDAVREALTGIKPRRPATYDLDGRDAGKVRVMLTAGHDKADVVSRLCGAGLVCKPKGLWVDAWVKPSEELREAVEAAIKDIGRPQYVPSVHELADGTVQVVTNWRVRDETLDALKKGGFDAVENPWPNWIDVKGRAKT